MHEVNIYLPVLYGTCAAAIYPVAKGVQVRISWIVPSWMNELVCWVGRRGGDFGEGRGLPGMLSERTAMPRSADRHNKTTSRPTRNTHSAAPRTLSPLTTPLLSALANRNTRRTQPLNNYLEEEVIGGAVSSWLKLIYRSTPRASNATVYKCQCMDLINFLFYLFGLYLPIANQELKKEEK